jgi:hypothetical protein
MSWVYQLDYDDDIQLTYAWECKGVIEVERRSQ